MAVKTNQPTSTRVLVTGHLDRALASSRAGARSWGICIECKMGRAHREDIPALLDLHRINLRGGGELTSAWLAPPAAHHPNPGVPVTASVTRSPGFVCGRAAP